jgi:hypothetical protein
MRHGVTFAVRCTHLGDCVIWVGVMGAVIDGMRCYGHCGGGARNGGADIEEATG